MRTNPAAFALPLGMGLIVLLIGFLALSAAGLVSVGPATEVTAGMPVDSLGESSRIIASAESRPLPPVSFPNGEAIVTGDALFKNNCAQCHAVNDKVVGPALAGITKRRRLPWLVSWVHNSAKVIASGDEYALKLYDDNGQQQMPSFPNLSTKEIAGILAWVEWQESQANSAGAVVTVSCSSPYAR
ncbi:c-type cytochrome [Hymenobacter psoromatis]|uniref:c-type cytochrome n=1 Tax=Hymenobacter psoromatis TaxID=1484116 RepID=UPI001CBE9FD0|nr:cytochrome c [Hymenobacter psoromatis]